VTDGHLDVQRYVRVIVRGGICCALSEDDSLAAADPAMFAAAARKVGATKGWPSPRTTDLATEALADPMLPPL
jgi:hypothetical protein